MSAPKLHRILGAVSAAAMLLLTATPTAATAQVGKGTQVELGTFGTFTKYNSNLGLGNEFGAGGRLGIFFSRMLPLEGRQVESPRPVSAGPSSPTPRWEVAPGRSDSDTSACFIGPPRNSKTADSTSSWVPG